jgi:hypothetical protein
MKAGIRIALVALLLAPTAVASDNSPQVVLATPGGAGGAIERFTIRFSQAMVPLGDPRAAAPIAVTCSVNGEGRWVDQQTYVWEFANALPGGTTCEAKTRDGLKSASGYALADTRSFTLDAGGPTARAVLPGTREEIEEDQVFLVAANMPATPQSIAANAYCAVDGIGEKIAVDVLPADTAGKVLVGLGSDRWEARNFLEQAGLPTTIPAAAADRQKALASVTALRCRRALPPGRDMALVWGADITGAGGKRAGADQRFDYTVRKPFTARFECGRTGPQAGCSPVEKAHVRFSAPVPMSEAAKVRIETADGKSIAPKFEDSDKRNATTSDITFSAPLPVATTAKLTIPAGIKDESGRALANAERFPLDIRFDQAPPLVKFAAGFGIVEAKQGGVLPVTVRNVEPALQGQNLGVSGQRVRVAPDDGEIAGWLRTVAKADETDIETIERGSETIRINHTGERPILKAGQGAPMKVALPGKGKDFEVVGIPLGQPGFYVVELASPILGRALLGRDTPRYVASAALVTDMAVHFKWGRERSLAWVTQLSDGKPAANAEVRITDSCTGKLLARGVTDRTGGLFVPAGLPEPETYGGCDYDSSPHPLMISARRGDDYSFTLTEWGEGIRPYDFDLPYGYSARGETVHTVFDRALVRQGETIHMKHILRRPVGAGFALAPGVRGTLKLSHRGSETQFELPLAIDANGIGENSWTAPQGAPMGDYDLSIVAEGRTIETSQSFKLDEYRLPTMRATVTGPKAAAIRPANLPLDLYVGYLSGGGASSLPVDLRVGWFAHTSAPDGYDNFTFGGRAVKEGVRPLNGDGEEERTELPPTQMLPARLGGDGTARQTIGCRSP